MLSLKNILQSKRKLGLMHFSGQAEKIINRCVSRMLPLIFGIGGMKWWLQSECEDTAPSTCTAAGVHSQAMADAPQTQTEHQDMPQSWQLKGEEWGSVRNQEPNKSHYFHQCCRTCSYPIGFGKLLCRTWHKRRLAGEGFFFHQGFGVEKSCCR